MITKPCGNLQKFSLVGNFASTEHRSPNFWKQKALFLSNLKGMTWIWRIAEEEEEEDEEEEEEEMPKWQ